MSLDINREPGFHFDLGRQLGVIRNQNILIIGSGNIIHNLSMVDFNEAATPFKWAVEFDGMVKNLLVKNDFERLIDYLALQNSKMAIPTSDHYLPMLYILGMKEENEKITFIHESFQNGSIAMRSFIIGK